MTDDIEAFTADIPAEIRAMLGEADAETDRDEQDRRLQAAVAAAPDNLALRIAAYAFYFYASRLEDAIPHAEACLAIAAKALGVAADWRQVSPQSACFAGFERPQRVYLKSLYALGYCRARLGDPEAAQALLRKAACLDPDDRLGAATLADLVARGRAEDDDDDDDDEG